MKKRRPIEIWPAFADLMTVIAVVALSLTVSVSESFKAVVAKERQAVQESEKKLADFEEKKIALEKKVQEAARNEKMFVAIQKAQQIVDELSGQSRLRFSSDQSLQFGDNLISFATDSCTPMWRGDGAAVLHRFCLELEKVSQSLTSDFRRSFVLQVEGHTDSTLCPGDPHCNWRLSSCRAASFVAIMKTDAYCPGGNSWEIMPIGYAASSPVSLKAEGNRRIAIRLMPNYRRMISSEIRR